MANAIKTLEWKSMSHGPAKIKTLLVDEDPSDVRYYYGMLRALGHEVAIAGSYSEGMSLLGREGFDMVIVGQGSPAFEGREVVARAMEINPETPVLVVARTLDIDCYLEALEMGAVDYLERCAAPRDFMRAVDAHLQIKTAA